MRRFWEAAKAAFVSPQNGTIGKKVAAAMVILGLAIGGAFIFAGVKDSESSNQQTLAFQPGNYTELERLANLFRAKSPNIAKAFDQVELHLKRLDAGVQELGASPPPPPPPPPPSGCALPAFPDASCTGVPAGVTLTPSGAITITTAGTVIDALDITGAVTVNAPNVTIKRTRIRSNAMYVINNNSTGLLVEDTEIINRPIAGQNNCHNGIGDANFALRRVEVTGCENAATLGGDNIVIEDSYIHDLDNIGPSYVWGNGPHTDGLQMAPGADNIVVRHNSIDPIGAVVGSGGTSAIIMGVNGSQSNVRIENNYLDGRQSSYALYLARQPSTIYVNGNRMLSGQYGYTACAKLGNTVAEFNDNRDAATLALINPDNGVGGGCTN